MTRIAIIGTSWWVDAMYLPALADLESVEVVALAGRDLATARERAAAWAVGDAYDDWRRMLDEVDPEGVIVAASNPVHYPATRHALESGIHVLCEKPVADTFGEAMELAQLAERQRLITMVPFTYAFMPGFVFLSRLVEEGYVGRIHSVGLHYHAGYALSEDYDWKLDARRNPGGALGDIGSHFLDLALELAGPVDAVTARLDTVGHHPAADGSGEPYPVASDSAVVAMQFRTGGQGVLHASSVAYEGTSMDQRHVIEVHGSEGTLRYVCDWDSVQEVSGARRGAGPVRPLAIPDDIWGSLRRETVHDTYRDVFRTSDVMARRWASAIAMGEERVEPDLRDGARVQQLIDASLQSSQEGRRVEVARVGPAGIG